MKLSYVRIGGEERPVCFSLTAIESLEDAFGSLDQMQKQLSDGRVKAINTVLEILFAAGAAYCKAMDIECPEPLKCRPGDLIGVDDNGIVKEIFSALHNDSERKVEAKSKN